MCILFLLNGNQVEMAGGEQNSETKRIRIEKRPKLYESIEIIDNYQL